MSETLKANWKGREIDLHQVPTLTTFQIFYDSNHRVTKNGRPIVKPSKDTRKQLAVSSNEDIYKKYAAWLVLRYKAIWRTDDESFLEYKENKSRYHFKDLKYHLRLLRKRVKSIEFRYE